MDSKIILDNNTQKIKEYDFLEIGDCIYRVFGIFHPDNYLLVLLRYYYENQKWTKPPKYGAEENNPISLSKYKCILHNTEFYQTYLGLINLSEIKKHYSTTNPIFLNGKSIANDFIRELNELFFDLIRDYGIILGITGSHLINLSNPNSDIDIIIYGLSSCKEIVPEFFQRLNHLRKTNYTDSVILQRAIKKNIPPLSLNSRRGYSYVYNNKKIDIHFSIHDLESFQSIPKIQLIKKETLSVEIIEDYGGIFFPGIFIAFIHNSSLNLNKCYIISMDHTAMFLQIRDKFRGEFIIYIVLESFDYLYHFKSGDILFINKTIIDIFPSPYK